MRLITKHTDGTGISELVKEDCTALTGIITDLTRWPHALDLPLSIYITFNVALSLKPLETLTRIANHCGKLGVRDQR